MRLARLLQFKKQQEEQGRLLLQQAQSSLVKEQTRLKILQKITQEAGGYFEEGAIFDTSLLRTYTGYLDRLRAARNLQGVQVYKARKGVEKAYHNWEGLRVEKEKLEQIYLRFQEIQEAREERLEQAELDEIGRRLVFRGGQ